MRAAGIIPEPLPIQRGRQKALDNMKSFKNRIFGRVEASSQFSIKSFVSPAMPIIPPGLPSMAITSPPELQGSLKVSYAELTVDTRQRL